MGEQIHSIMHLYVMHFRQKLFYHYFTVQCTEMFVFTHTSKNPKLLATYRGYLNLWGLCHRLTCLCYLRLISIRWMRCWAKNRTKMIKVFVFLRGVSLIKSLVSYFQSLYKCFVIVFRSQHIYEGFRSSQESQVVGWSTTWMFNR